MRSGTWAKNALPNDTTLAAQKETGADGTRVARGANLRGGSRHEFAPTRYSRCRYPWKTCTERARHLGPRSFRGVHRGDRDVEGLEFRHLRTAIVTRFTRLFPNAGAGISKVKLMKRCWMRSGCSSLNHGAWGTSQIGTEYFPQHSLRRLTRFGPALLHKAFQNLVLNAMMHAAGGTLFTAPAMAERPCSSRFRIGEKV